MTGIVVSESIANLWDQINNSELSSSVVGEYEVRCIYVRNYSLNNETMKQCQVWVEQNTASPFTDIDIAIGTAFTGDTEQTVASEDTLPDNVGWTFARGEENAEFLGDIPPGQGKSLWIRRHAGPAKSGSSYASDNYILRFKFLRTGALEPGPGPGPGPGPPPSDSTLDPFGIRMIYKTQTSGTISAPFYMNMNDPLSDCRFSVNTGQTITKNGDGSWGTGAGPRIRMYTSAGPPCQRDVIYNKVLDTYDHDTWGERGYMYSPADWKNVEITGYFKVVSVNEANTEDRKIYLYSRTLRHNTNVGSGCSGSAYKGVIYGESQELKFHKESFHNTSQPCGDRNIVSVLQGIPRTDNNTWFGMKVIMWNYQNPQSTNPGAQFVHLEIWLDLSATNTWTRMAQKDDTGGWYPGAPSTTCPGDEFCGGSQAQIIKWGGPTTEIRWDAGYTNVHFKNLSCREIIPSTMVLPPPAPPPPGPPPAPPPSPPGAGTDVFGTTEIYASKPGGDSWSALPWSNGENRLITIVPSDTCTADPYDSRLRVTSGDQNVNINGSGIMTVAGAENSPRVVVLGTWQNVESTAYVKVSHDITDVNLDQRSKTDHYCVSGFTTGDNFGGYIHNYDFGNNEANFKKEVSHNIGYTSRTAGQPFTLNANVWYGFKAVCYNSGSGVKLESYIDTTDGENGGTWTKVTEFADTGSWSHEVVTEACGGSSFRFNRGGAIATYQIKKWTVREIDPSIVPAPPPPPSPPAPGPTPSPPPPPPAPITTDTFGIKMLNATKSGGKEWFSTTFSVNPARSYIPPPNKLSLDTYDVNLYFVLIGDSTASISAGEMEVDGGSPRFFIEGPWTNTEMTSYVRFSFATAHADMYTHLGSRSNHEVMDSEGDRCGWGRYVAKFDHGRGGGPATACDKEIIHPIHSPEHDAHPFSGFFNNKWIGIKQITRTITSTGRVKVEAWVDETGGVNGGTWVKNSEWIDDGTDEPVIGSNQSYIDDCMTSSDNNTPLKINGTGSSNQDNLKQVWKHASRHCYWRTEQADKTRYKWVSVREINAL